MSDWTCRCTAKNADGTRYCEGCGAENPKTPRGVASVPKVQETHAPARLPTYPEPAPGDDALIRAELAKVKALLGIDGIPKRRLDLPPIDPVIREKLR